MVVGGKEEHKWRRQANSLLGTFFKFDLKPRDCTFFMVFHLSSSKVESAILAILYFKHQDESRAG